MRFTTPPSSRQVVPRAIDDHYPGRRPCRRANTSATVYRERDLVLWFIGGDTANVWSSARAMLVPTTDPDYVTWLDSGNQPANAAIMSDVEATLAITFPVGTPRTYAADQRYRKASGGVVISSLSAVPFLTDPVSRNTANSAYDYALANAGVVVQWKLADGVTFIRSTRTSPPW